MATVSPTPKEKVRENRSKLFRYADKKVFRRKGDTNMDTQHICTVCLRQLTGGHDSGCASIVDHYTLRYGEWFAVHVCKDIRSCRKNCE